MKVKLKEHRQARGWSQQDAAVSAGLSIDCVRSIECGRANPSLKTAFLLKKALGLSCIDELIEDAM